MTTTQPAAQPSTPVSTGRDDRAATPVVAFLGTGRMGGPMAANLARGGFDVRVWNRTVAHAEPLAADGAVVAASPAEAARGATIVITMLADGAATEQAATGPGGLLDRRPRDRSGCRWAPSASSGRPGSPASPPTAARCSSTPRSPAARARPGPGSWSSWPAAPRQVRDVLAPVFGVLGRDTVWLGPAGNGTRAKLVLNNWLADLAEMTAETLSFARRLGLDPAEVVDLLQSNPLGAPYAVQKARVMLAGDFSPAFALKHALKDAELAAQAAQASGATLTLTSALLPRWRDTAASGHADDDVAAVYLTA